MEFQIARQNVLEHQVDHSRRLGGIAERGRFEPELIDSGPQQVRQRTKRRPFRFAR